MSSLPYRPASPFVVAALGTFVMLLMFPGLWDRSAADTFVDIGGYSLGVHCAGTGSPTVIMESGLGSSSGTWREVQPDVSGFTHVCSYDRAGIGLSDNRLDTDIDGTYIPKELHALIGKLGLQPPFVFVGASIGGMYIRSYADQYPGEAAGFVFVDPSHEDQFARFDAEDQVAHFGDEGGSHIDFGPVVDELHKAASFGAAPVVSITRGLGTNATWLDLRRDLAARSTNSMLVVANEAGHEIQHDQPGVVVRAVRLVVDSVRSGQAMPACSQAYANLDATCEPVR